MAKKVLGYKELSWVCPNCATRNPGSARVCRACGAPQPDRVEFELEANAALLQDESAAQAASQGADIHCPYCGTRNPHGTPQCTRCGGDLSEGALRRAGQVMASAANPPAAAPNPSAPQPLSSPAHPVKASAFRPWMALPLLAVLLLCCVVLGMVFFRTETVYGAVSSVAWQRSIEVLTLQAVTREAWRDEVPEQAQTLSCRQEVRRTQQEPAPNAREVCGTPYDVDKGNGYSETQQDCVYEVYDDLCRYSSQEWVVTDEVTLRGEDLSPRWPSLPAEAREGSRSELYWVYFDTQKGALTYQPEDAAWFSRFAPGSEWLLSVNGAGQILDVSLP